MNNPQSFLSSLRLKKKKKKKKTNIFQLGRPVSYIHSTVVAPPPKPEFRPTMRIEKKNVRSFKNIDESVLPVKDVFSINEHNGIVTALDFDQKGAILISGSTDYTVKYWEFHSSPYPMKSKLEPLDEEGCPIMGNHCINEITWSKVNDCFLVVCNYSRMKIFSRECKFLTESILGDMYLLDKRYTNGHTGAIYSASWHPVFHHSFLSSSLDGTIRLWNAKTCDVKNTKVFKVLGKNKKYTPCTCCTWARPSGKLFAGMGFNGTMFIFEDNNETRNSSPVHKFENAHIPNTHTSRMDWSEDGYSIITRGGGEDDTLKFWDFRKLTNGPVKIFDGLPNYYQQTECKFSKNGKFVFTGTSQVQDQNEPGKFLCFEKESLKEVGQVSFPNTSVLRVSMHEDLNQIFLGCSDYEIKVLHDPEISKKGVMFPLSKKGKEIRVEDLQDASEIYTPHALNLYRKRDAKGTIWAKNRKNWKKSHRPSNPQRGGSSGMAGEIGHSEQEKMLRKMGIGIDKSFMHQDPREELWKVAKKAAEDPKFIGKAYEKTQPKLLLQKVQVSESRKRKRGETENLETEEDVSSRFSKRRKTD